MTTTKENQLIRVLVGVDASRRVGWAKYYDKSEALVTERYLGMRRAGLFLGLIRGATAAGATAGEIDGFLSAIVDELMSEFDDQKAIDEGVGAADSMVRGRWGSWDAAVFQMQNPDMKHQNRKRNERRYSLSQVQHLFDETGEGHCPNCAALMLQFSNDKNHFLLKVKCHKCGKRHGFTVDNSD